MTGLLERADAPPAAPAADPRPDRPSIWPRLRADLRLARRQSLRGWASSLLVVALIALPMTLVAGAIVFGMGHVATTEERIRAELGGADAWVSIVHGPDPSLTQYLDEPTWWDVAREEQTGELINEELPPHGSARPFLPAGAIEIGAGRVTAETAGGIGAMTAVIGDAAASVLRGRFELIEGRAPASDSEVVVSPGALERLGVGVGDRLELTEPVATYTVTGVLKRAEDPHAAEVVFLPGTPANRALQEDVSSTVWYLPEWSPTPDDVRALNREGMIVFDRDLFVAPGDMANPWASGDALALSMVWLIGAAAAFAGYLVVLLAGAAFSVSARRQQRALAVAASVGATRADVFRVVLLQGTVLGGVGGIVGSAAGIGLGILFLHLFDDGSTTAFQGVHVPWWGLAAVIAFAVIVGTIAAIAPARAATKGEVIAALRGSRRPARVRVDRPLWGVLLIAAGVGLTAVCALWLAAINAEEFVSGDDGRRTICIIGIILGPILLQVGVMLGGHWLISLLARPLSRLGLASRIASRDAAANPGRIVPAFAAIAACAFLAAASLGSIALVTKQAERGWTYAAPVGSVSVAGWMDDIDRQHLAVGTVVTGWQDDGAGASRGVYIDAEATARSLLESAGPGTLGTVWDAGTGRWDATGTLLNPDDILAFPRMEHIDAALAADQCKELEIADCRWHQSPWWNLGIVDATELEAVTGEELSTAELAAYRDGAALVLDPDYIRDDGTVAVAFSTQERLAKTEVAEAPTDVVSVAAIRRDQPQRQVSVLIAPELADSWGLRSGNWTVIATYDVPLTTAQVDSLQQEADTLSRTGEVGMWPHLESGPPDAAPWMWLAVGATAVLVIGASSVALGLARVERRPDDATLAAVGGTRRLRRGIALWQAAIVAGLGMVTGTVAGILPVWGVALASERIYNPPSFGDMPWLWLVVLALGLPAVIALVSWLVPPRDPDLTRRTAIA
ncbi:ABC transporter permease [Microbacterium saccharophilum]|uniref:ABC transporter permease n=1 Tax=Microbacterium saccharophilum TaxID=1213358 RepID=A0A5C8HSB1_9MICO|nr:ABC transporter permease [Microbacterium saccharophilum]TXK08834.1 ABC transporter permease [Microbacterium saccharophilum]GEP48161.1 hypothetical protein MSA03_16690 [Microbacterium saccharophilum]